MAVQPSDGAAIRRTACFHSPKVSDEPQRKESDYKNNKNVVMHSIGVLLNL